MILPTATGIFKFQTMTLSLNVRIQLIQCYYESNRSLTQGLRKFRTLHNLRTGLCSIRNYGKLIRKFEETGSVADKKKSGRPKVINDVTVAEVLHVNNEISINNHYGISSVAQVSRQLQMSNSTV